MIKSRIKQLKYDYSIYKSYIVIKDEEACKTFVLNNKKAKKQVEFINRLLSEKRIPKKEISAQILNSLLEKYQKNKIFIYKF